MTGRTFKESDLLKTIAVLSVILQGVLAFVHPQLVSEAEFSFALWIMQVVKYSAPMFIFAICFDVVANQNLAIKTYWQHKFWELVVPFLIWSFLYLFLFQSWSTQNLLSNLQQIITGSSAPHLWYTVMMLQFQLLVPLMIGLATWVQGNQKRVVFLIIGTLSVFVFYREVGPQIAFRYHDRFFLGYSLFASLGIIFSQHRQYLESIWRYRQLALGGIIVMIGLSAYAIWQQPVQGVQLSQINYYQSFMVGYNVLMIVFALNLAYWLKQKQRFINRFCTWIATYAFRAYLANFFCLQLVGGLLKPAITSLPVGVQGSILFLITAALAFGFVYGLEQLNQKIRQSSPTLLVR